MEKPEFRSCDLNIECAATADWSVESIAETRLDIINRVLKRRYPTLLGDSVRRHRRGEISAAIALNQFRPAPEECYRTMLMASPTSLNGAAIIVPTACAVDPTTLSGSVLVV